MNTTRRIIFALTLFLAFSGTAMAMHHGKAADLSPEKQAVIEKAHNDFAAATVDLKRQIFAKESALNAELYGDQTDDQNVDILVAEINALHGKIYSEKVKMQRIIAREGILPEMGHGMMGGGGCPMMSGMKGGHGQMKGQMKGQMHGKMHGQMHGKMHGKMHGQMHGQMHDETTGAAPEVTTDANAPGGHGAHAPANQ